MLHGSANGRISPGIGEAEMRFTGLPGAEFMPYLQIPQLTRRIVCIYLGRAAAIFTQAAIKLLFWGGSRAARPANTSNVFERLVKFAMIFFSHGIL